MLALYLLFVKKDLAETCLSFIYLKPRKVEVEEDKLKFHSLYSIADLYFSFPLLKCLDRALQTFSLYCEIENKYIFYYIKHCLGFFVVVVTRASPL